MKPFVSVIVPVYGVEKYIKKCLTSLVDQTLDNIEIIVVNDGSKDNSQKIIDKFVEKYPTKVKSFIKENGGQGSARNFGLKHANGEYIGYVDSDDYVEKTMFEKLYNNAKKNNSDIAICGAYVINNDKIITEYEPMLLEDPYLNAFFGKKAVWNKIYKKKILTNNKILFRSKKWYEDFDFTIKTLINAKNISYINEPLYNYLIREGSTMNNSNIERNLEILEAFDEIKKYDQFYDYIEFLAVDHIYISAVVRVLLADCSFSDKKRIINILLEYMKENFPFYPQNKFLMYLSRNRKVVYWLLKMKLYRIVKLIFIVKNRGSLIWKKSIS